MVTLANRVVPVRGGLAMTPHTRSPDPRDTGQARGMRTGSGAAGSGIAPTIGSSRTGPVGGLAPGLVARVQRRLAATGSSATDAAGLRAAVAETLVEDGVVLPRPACRRSSARSATS
jgi:hypothetical protein